MDASPSSGCPASLRTFSPTVGIVLGSGLGCLADALDITGEVPYSAIDGFPQSSVPGHAGRFIFGTLAGHRLVCAQGRVHLYEGRSAREVTAGIRLLASAGIRTLILTNAAGAVNEEMLPGEWMALTDHLNLTHASPLTGSPHFLDLSEVYSASLRQAFQATAQSAGVQMFSGVYAGLAGPQYETPAEVRMLRTLGADAVGMSTVLEAIQARALNLEVAGFSCLTNWAAGIGNEPLSHDEVLETGTRAAQRFVTVLKQWLLAAEARN